MTEDYLSLNGQNRRFNYRGLNSSLNRDVAS